MRVLLDECVPRRVQRYFGGHECQTVSQAGFAGKSNGELLTRAEHAPGFDVLLTVDKNLSYQQNISDRNIALLIIRARSNEIEDLLPHIPPVSKRFALLGRVKLSP